MACSLLRRSFIVTLRPILSRRSFLSDEFRCEESWETRLESPIFKKIQLNEFLTEIDRKFHREKRGSAIDVDIFANAVGAAGNDDVEDHMEHLEQLLHRFRLTPQTYSTLDSTHHAVIRLFLRSEAATNTLMRILDDRMNYGIFPDEYDFVLLLDHFLKCENWRDATRTGVLMMLQETLKVPIAKEMATFAVLKFAPSIEDAIWDPQASEAPEEPSEEIKIRVKYLKPDYFDNHFDLRRPQHLVGKTLVKLSEIRNKDDVIKMTMELLGWSMFERKDRVEKMVREGKTEIIGAPGIVKTIKLHLNDEELFSRLKPNEEIDFECILKTEIKESVEEHEKNYIQRQKKIYSQWNSQRIQELENQYQMYLAESRRKSLEQKRKEIEENEEIMFFFDNFEEMERRKEEKMKAWYKKLPRVTWSKRVTIVPKPDLPQGHYKPIKHLLQQEESHAFKK